MLFRSRELLVPIFRNAKIVGVFGVGNKEHDYLPEDIELVATLGDLAWDIVLRKRAEVALHLSEERFRLTFDHSPAGTAMVAPDFRFMKANDSLCRFLGYSEGELHSKTFADITHPEDRERDFEQVKRLLAGEIDRYDTEKRYLRKTGGAVWARVTVALVRDIDRQPLFFLPIIQDISARKQMERALLESESRYMRIIDTAREGIWSLDEQWQTTSVNQHMAAMLGSTPDDMKGQPVDDFMFAEDLADHRQRMAALEHGQAGYYERRLRHRDGHAVWTMVSATPLKDSKCRVDRKSVV